MLNATFRRSVRSYSTLFKEGDYVLVKPLKKTTSDRKWLSAPLTPGKRINTNTGSISHDDIIGTHSNDRIWETQGKKVAKYIISKPTTEEYINLIAREAQPIYPLDAAAIVSLADFHMDYPELNKETGELVEAPVQFLEAGTGHGSLSLAICKQLHAANCYAKDGDLSKRGAILHTIDCREKHSKTGEKTVKSFQKGIYKNDAEFHVSESPSHWLEEESAKWAELYSSKNQETIKALKDVQYKEAFLSGCFLDMAGFHKHLKTISKYLLLDAPVVIFCPSLTQIMEALYTVDKDPETKLHFVKTVQLLDGVGGGLKEWDTRKAFIRASGEVGWVCRPKVGIRVVGGGFVIIFKKAANNISLEPTANGSTESSETVKEETETESSTDTPKNEESIETVSNPADINADTETAPIAEVHPVVESEQATEEKSKD